MKWWIIVIFAINGNHEPLTYGGGQGQPGPYQSKQECEKVAFLLENDRDWVLECVPAPKKRLTNRRKSK